MADLKYFQHEFSASSDPKIKYIQRKFGIKAYAWYFKILEQMGFCNGILDLSKTEQMYILADDLHIDEIEQLQEFIDVACEIRLFNCELWKTQKHLASDGYLSRQFEAKNQLESKTSRAKKAAQSRWAKTS